MSLLLLIIYGALPETFWACNWWRGWRAAITLFKSVWPTNHIPFFFTTKACLRDTMKYVEWIVFCDDTMFQLESLYSHIILAIITYGSTNTTIQPLPAFQDLDQKKCLKSIFLAGLVWNKAIEDNQLSLYYWKYSMIIFTE